MVEKIKMKLRESSTARWTVLGLVSFTMLTAYILSDVMAPLKTMLEQQLGWDNTDYGLFTMGYGLFNVFLFMLIFGGIILDRMGPRFTGIMAVALMIVGTLTKYWAISTDFSGAMMSMSIFGWDIFTMKAQVFWAMIGFAIAGMGIEIIGITASKIVVKWFSGYSLATAMGLNTAAGRIGTAVAMFGSAPIAKAMGSPSSPLLFCLVMFCVGLISFLIFIMMDVKADKQMECVEKEEMGDDEKFKLRDILDIAKIRGFWYLTILCVLFYSAVFPFLKYATDLMIQKFSVPTEFAGAIPGLLPFGNILLTPLFGSIYDRKGKGATIMMVGSLMLVSVHLLFAVPMLNSSWMAVALILILGAAFSLVPSAMWPSVPKIIPFKKLGTAYAMIFWVQNIGLSLVPLLIGVVLDKYCVVGKVMIDGAESNQYNYMIPMLIFASFGALSIFLSYLLKREDAKKGYGLELPNNKQ